MAAKAACIPAKLWDSAMKPFFPCPWNALKAFITATAYRRGERGRRFVWDKPCLAVSSTAWASLLIKEILVAVTPTASWNPRHRRQWSERSFIKRWVVAFGPWMHSSLAGADSALAFLAGVGSARAL